MTLLPVNASLLIALQIVLPLAALVQWRRFCFALYLLALWAHTWAMPGEASAWVVAAWDVAVAGLGLLASAEAVAHITRASESRTAVRIEVVGLGFVAAVGTAGYHGLTAGWNLLESIRLSTHAGYAAACASALLYAAGWGLEVSPAHLWHGTRWAAWMGAHVAISMLPKPTYDTWWSLQVCYRLILLALLIWWVLSPRPVWLSRRRALWRRALRGGFLRAHDRSYLIYSASCSSQPPIPASASIIEASSASTSKLKDWLLVRRWNISFRTMLRASNR